MSLQHKIGAAQITDKSMVVGDAPVAQWICLLLPFCRPGFESQAHHLCFNQFQFEFKL